MVLSSVNLCSVVWFKREFDVLLSICIVGLAVSVVLLCHGLAMQAETWQCLGNNQINLAFHSDCSNFAD